MGQRTSSREAIPLEFNVIYNSVKVFLRSLSERSQKLGEILVAHATSYHFYRDKYRYHERVCPFLYFGLCLCARDMHLIKLEQLSQNDVVYIKFLDEIGVKTSKLLEDLGKRLLRESERASFASTSSMTKSQEHSTAPKALQQRITGSVLQLSRLYWISNLLEETLKKQVEKDEEQICEFLMINQEKCKLFMQDISRALGKHPDQKYTLKGRNLQQVLQVLRQLVDMFQRVKDQRHMSEGDAISPDRQNIIYQNETETGRLNSPQKNLQYRKVLMYHPYRPSLEPRDTLTEFESHFDKIIDFKLDNGINSLEHDMYGLEISKCHFLWNRNMASRGQELLEKLNTDENSIRGWCSFDDGAKPYTWKINPRDNLILEKIQNLPRPLLTVVFFDGNIQRFEEEEKAFVKQVKEILRELDK